MAEQRSRAARLARAFLRAELESYDVVESCGFQDPDPLISALVDLVLEDPSQSAILAPADYPAYRTRLELLIAKLDPEGQAGETLLPSDTEPAPEDLDHAWLYSDRARSYSGRPNPEPDWAADRLRLVGCAALLFFGLVLTEMMCGRPRLR
jgi:hypothetical protein